MLRKCLWLARELFDFNLEMINEKIASKRMSFGKPIDYASLPRRVYEQAPCCFVLSTGRCGTKLLTKLMGLSKEIKCKHVPFPELIYFSKLAYETFEEDRKKFKFAINMARYELIQEAFLRKQTYVETNNRITFFAPFLTEIFKQAKFIHLVRHPADFVRSGINREWYKGRNIHDTGRIVPQHNKQIDWSEMTQIERIAWLWNETNQFIENFKLNLKDPDRILFVKAEDLFSRPETTQKVFSFLKLVSPPIKKITKIIRRSVNVQRNSYCSKYDQWKQQEKDQLSKYAGLFSKYNYNL
ncbi:MAG: sulfotransferase [Omnitrophica bacterium]|nr:sulfotransferase [Candidatus Omnitrophota bacterium]